MEDVSAYAVGFARPDRQSWAQPAEQAMSWHAVEAHRPADELDGEVELAVCGAIVQVWGSQHWERVQLGPQLLRGVPRAHRAGPAPRRLTRAVSRRARTAAPGRRCHSRSAAGPSPGMRGQPVDADDRAVGRRAHPDVDLRRA